MSAQCIMIASSKGGIGKSTVALGVSAALAQRGRRVLLCDLDFGNPCLDMLSGAESSVLYTVYDVLCGRCSADEAAVRPFKDSQLYLLAAPSREDCNIGDAELVAETVKAAAEGLECDFVILDTGAGISFGASAAAAAADKALIVAGHSPISIRSAESTAQRVGAMGVGDIRLIINSFDAGGVRGTVGRRGIFSIIDTSGLPLFGVVPYDYLLAVRQEKRGETRAGLSGAAFDNIARRLLGENVPLFYGMKKMRRVRDKFYI